MIDDGGCSFVCCSTNKVKSDRQQQQPINSLDDDDGDDGVDDARENDFFGSVALRPNAKCPESAVNRFLKRKLRR
jgi:hypothetical protein